jgi:hypothetical protein
MPFNIEASHTRALTPLDIPRFRKVASTASNNGNNICSGPVISRSEIPYSHAKKSVGFQGGKLRAII